MSAPLRLPRIPLSPSSPPDTGVKSELKPLTTATTPKSPVSPPLMSVATKSYVSSYGQNQHTDEMAQRPRSPTSNYLQQSQQRPNQSNTTQELSLKRSSPMDEDNEHRDKRQKIEADSDRMEIDSTTTPTNHDRQGQADTTGLRDRENSASLASTTVPNLEQDSGELFLLCRRSVPRSQPDPSKHLLHSFGLIDLLKSVARNDPLTGEKINKLRKSYEGQIKTFGLPGRNKPVKADREEDEIGPLRKLATVQDDRWQNEQGNSKIEVGDEFKSKLQRAMQIQPGRVRNNNHWEDVLGLENKPQSNIQRQPVPAARVPNGIPRPQPGPGLDKRSTRGKKRSYGDDSFVGYGEGYSDGDDPGDVDDDFTGRKRKKESFGQYNR